MTSQNDFKLPPALEVISRQNKETWRKLDDLRPLLDLLLASKDPATEEARRDLAEILASIDGTTTEILHRQLAMETQVKEMAKTLATLKPFLDRMTRRLP